MTSVAGVPRGVGSPGLWISIGRSGSGKTYGIRQQLYRAARRIPIVALDLMGEWTPKPGVVVGLPRDLARVTCVVSSVEKATRYIERGARLAIVQPPSSTEVTDVAEEACAWAWRRNASSVRGVAIPEAHRVAPQGKLSPAIGAVVTAWRHGRVAAWLDTQRFALLNRTAIEQATETRIHAVGRRDREAIAKDFGADELNAALAECARRMRAGQPGWHVKVDIAADGPFDLERE